MKLKYIRAHPDSPLGMNYTQAHTNGWVLVGFVYWEKYKTSYPVFRESYFRWFKRVFLKQGTYDGAD